MYDLIILFPRPPSPPRHGETQTLLLQGFSQTNSNNFGWFDRQDSRDGARVSLLLFTLS